MIEYQVGLDFILLACYLKRKKQINRENRKLVLFFLPIYSSLSSFFPFLPNGKPFWRKEIERDSISQRILEKRWIYQILFISIGQISSFSERGFFLLKTPIPKNPLKMDILISRFLLKRWEREKEDSQQDRVWPMMVFQGYRKGE